MKHVEEYNKLIIKQEFVHLVRQLLREICLSIRTYLLPALILQITLCISNVTQPHDIFGMLYPPPYTPAYTLRTAKFNIIQEKQCTYYVTTRRVRESLDAVEKQ